MSGRGGGLGEAGIGVLGHDFRHGDGALGQGGEGRGIDVGGGDGGGALAQKYAQAEVLAFGTLDVFGLAQTARDRERGSGDEDGVGSVGSGGAGVR